MDITQLKTIAKTLPPNIAVLMRGPTGVGKSFAAKAIAEELGLPYIDVRGSTMDESDMGIPDLEASKEAGAYTKMVPSWYLRGCREPVVLMLDELNRSMPQVMQGFFQIVLDRELGNLADGASLKLHPETRVIAAVNCGGEYDVNDMDPALLRRFWVTDIEPTVTDWIEWAKATELDSVLIDFVGQNPEHWRVDPASVEPGTVVPTPASWHRLSDSLIAANLAPVNVAGTNPALLYPIARGFVGTEAAIAFQDFVKTYERQISAEMVLSGETTADDVIDSEASVKLAVLDKLVSHSAENDWSDEQAKNVVAFGKGCPDEQMVHLWNSVMGTKNMTNIQALHKLVGSEIVALVRKARELSKK